MWLALLLIGTYPFTDWDGDNIADSVDNCFHFIFTSNCEGPVETQATAWHTPNGFLVMGPFAPSWSTLPTTDSDGDGVIDLNDNCLNVPNADQDFRACVGTRDNLKVVPRKYKRTVRRMIRKGIEHDVSCIVFSTHSNSFWWSQCRFIKSVMTTILP
jgi:hypothetical protein